MYKHRLIQYTALHAAFKYMTDGRASPSVIAPDGLKLITYAAPHPAAPLPFPLNPSLSSPGRVKRVARVATSSREGKFQCNNKITDVSSSGQINSTVHLGSTSA